ncbi:uncharacterized protein LOC110431361 isoform X2 [Sorghum bicolor]|uniref:uncharacterized protein LOC110431361 isoform X2 n=1 Tax=Sorghum bicolor TaxID=4558 RepID=UPI000B424D44|nr:uncharacterized protein LOC110431361 isoform X2 [Sorghum bicolor]|eukprot:XP_021306101.1 uncharacterized protein LOC110431361 isoform X2 [Sorghum bicolor]
MAYGPGMAPFLLGSGSAIRYSTLIHLQHVLVTSAGSNDGRKKQSIRQAALTHFTKAVVITNLKLTAQIWRSTLKVYVKSTFFTHSICKPQVTPSLTNYFYCFLAFLYS